MIDEGIPVSFWKLLGEDYRRLDEYRNLIVEKSFAFKVGSLPEAPVGLTFPIGSSSFITAAHSNESVAARVKTWEDWYKEDWPVCAWAIDKSNKIVYLDIKPLLRGLVDIFRAKNQIKLFASLTGASYPDGEGITIGKLMKEQAKIKVELQGKYEDLLHTRLPLVLDDDFTIF